MNIAQSILANPCLNIQIFISIGNVLFLRLIQCAPQFHCPVFNLPDLSVYMQYYQYLMQRRQIRLICSCESSRVQILSLRCQLRLCWLCRMKLISHKVVQSESMQWPPVMADLCDKSLRMFGPLQYSQRIVGICYTESPSKRMGLKRKFRSNRARTFLSDSTAL